MKLIPRLKITGDHFIRDLIGLFLITAFVGAMVALLWKAIPGENEQLLSYMLGQLSGFVGGVVGFWYVSKAGEKELEAKRADNTNKAFDAIRAAQAAPASQPADDAIRPGDEVRIEKPEDQP